MKLLGVDFGTKKIGLAVSEGFLAEPYSVIRYEEEDVLLEKIKKVVNDEGVEKIVLGVSEAQMGQQSQAFGERLSKSAGVEVVLQDETLTTHEAQNLSIMAGIKRKKRRMLEDAYSAALILQSYIDQNES